MSWTRIVASVIFQNQMNLFANASHSFSCHISPNWDWSFPDAGQLPVPVLAIENVSFNYPGGKELYSQVDFGVDLQTRVALVGPNGGAFMLQYVIIII